MYMTKMGCHTHDIFWTTRFDTLAKSLRVNFTASMIIVFKLTIFNCNGSQPPDTFEKIANCVNNKIKLKQSNFERNAKTILGFEHLSSRIRDIEKIAT